MSIQEDRRRVAVDTIPVNLQRYLRQDRFSDEQWLISFSFFA